MDKNNNVEVDSRYDNLSTSSTLFSLAYLIFSLMGKTGYTATRYLSIGRNLYYLLKIK